MTEPFERGFFYWLSVARIGLIEYQNLFWQFCRCILATLHTVYTSRVWIETKRPDIDSSYIQTYENQKVTRCWPERHKTQTPAFWAGVCTIHGLVDDWIRFTLIKTG
jgi:hypothetical protein